MLYDEYAVACAEHRQRHGPLTVVMMEVGSFLEWYDAGDAVCASVRDVCELLNVQATRKNKAIPTISRSNPMLGGIPRHALPKYAPLLLSAGWKIVIMLQVTPPPNPTRRVVEILSPATCAASELLAGQPPDGVLMALHLERLAVKSGLLLSGWAVVEVATGRTWAGEPWSGDADKPCDGALVMDELHREILARDPCEVLVVGPMAQCEDSAEWKRVMSHLGLATNGPRRLSVDSSSCYARSAYQDAVLKKVYGDPGLLTPAELLGLERSPFALSALVAALQFAHDHCEASVKNVQRPVTYDPGQAASLVVAYNAMRQLDVIGSAGAPTLISLLDRCSTAMGSRALRERLLRPLQDIQQLEARYDDVERAMPRLEELRGHLQGVVDLQRAIRRAGLGRSSPTEAHALAASMRSVSRAAALWAGDEDDATSALATDLAEELERTFNGGGEPDGILIGGGGGNPFRPGICPELDAIQDDLKAQQALVVSAAEHLNQVAGVAGHVKVEHSDAVECVSGQPVVWLSVTARRWGAMVKAGVQDPCRRPHGFSSEPFSHDGGSRLTHPDLGAAYQDRLRVTRAALAREARARTSAFFEGLYHRWAGRMAQIIAAVERMDIACSSADVSRRWGHCRPVLEVSDGGGSSWVRAAGLRHPLIEAINDREPYVPNDVHLGCDGVQGMLLYGVNAVGKSSTMKALGLGVIMAQAGLFVAATSFHVRPYAQILTRIGMRDDLHRGHSTFMVEMLELRGILARASPNALVIGDELCSGTEAVSALAIVGASLQQLAHRRASFVFATHLHELTRIPAVTAIDGLRVCHLKVHVDGGVLRLDRKLEDGQGPETYGIEVCGTLDMGPRFMQDAHLIRRHLMGVPKHIVARTRSRYNADVYLDTCASCGGRAEETHHRIPQAMACSASGMIPASRDGRAGPFHKNRAFNLQPLCKACHDMEHAIPASARTS